MAELIPYKKKNVIYRLRDGSLAQKWYAGFLGFEQVSEPDRDPDDPPLIAEPIVSQDHRKFYTTSDKSDLSTIRQGIENEGASAGDSGESQDGPQNGPASANLDSMTVKQLQAMAQELGISTTGLNKANLIEEIEYAQQNHQDDYQ